MSLFVLGAGSAFAADGGGEHGHDLLPLKAEKVFDIGPFPVTNSMIMVWIVAAILIFVAQAATRNMKLVPSGVQNFVEWLVESLFNFFSGIMGEHLAKRTFWFLGTIFILILFSNWFGLIPGVGTIGFELHGADVVTEGPDRDTFLPFFRGANADVNLTMAMAGTFFILWFYWSFTEIGVKNFFLHIFAPKGEFKGVMLGFMVALFLMVGLIEMLSIAVRPIALTFRLYGNIYAGENMLETLMHKVPDFLQWLPVIPFYFLELLVGLIQALVFALLCAVFTKLMCEHHEDHDEEEHAEHEQDAGAQSAPADATPSP
ncbi:MAG: F0F1 ATP synthase subunit A [Akkermansiaceae bacterium]